MTAAEQSRKLEEAADALERASGPAVAYFRSEAQRLRSLGEFDAQSVEAMGLAEIILSWKRRESAS